MLFVKRFLSCPAQTLRGGGRLLSQLPWGILTKVCRSVPTGHPHKLTQEQQSALAAAGNHETTRSTICITARCPSLSKSKRC